MQKGLVRDQRTHHRKQKVEKDAGYRPKQIGKGVKEFVGREYLLAFIRVSQDRFEATVGQALVSRSEANYNAEEAWMRRFLTLRPR